MIKIQKPTKEDVKNIQQVFYKTWLATYPNKDMGITREDIKERFKDRFSENTLKKRVEDILDESGTQLFLIAKDGDCVVGVCKAKKLEKYNELKAIYIMPSYQGKGIGTKLWKKIKVFLGNGKDIIVHVAVYNKQAINFYQKLGFVDNGKRLVKEIHRMPISGTSIPEMELIIKVVK